MNRKKLGRFIAVRQRVERLRAGELAEATGRMQAAEDVEQEASAMHLSSIRFLLHGGDMTGDDLARRALTVAMTSEGLKRARAVLAERRVEHEVKTEAVIEARRDVRTLEVLSERLARAAHLEDRKRDQTLSDEAASRLGEKT